MQSAEVPFDSQRDEGFFSGFSKCWCISLVKTQNLRLLMNDDVFFWKIAIATEGLVINHPKKNHQFSVIDTLPTCIIKPHTACASLRYWIVEHQLLYFNCILHRGSSNPIYETIKNGCKVWLKNWWTDYWNIWVSRHHHLHKLFLFWAMVLVYDTPEPGFTWIDWRTRNLNSLTKEFQLHSKKHVFSSTTAHHQSRINVFLLAHFGALLCET